MYKPLLPYLHNILVCYNRALELANNKQETKCFDYLIDNNLEDGTCLYIIAKCCCDKNTVHHLKLYNELLAANGCDSMEYACTIPEEAYYDRDICIIEVLTIRIEFINNLISYINKS